MPVLTTFKDEGSAPVKVWTMDIEESARRAKRAAEARRWRQRNPEAARAAKARYMAKRGLAHNRARHLFERYGLTVAAFEKMLTDQNDCCAICEQPFGETVGKQPCVDHHHGSGRVRGLLHRDCNSALGIFRDSATLLRRAADYVDQEDTCL